MLNVAGPAQRAKLPSVYTLPGSGLYVEGIIHDTTTGTLFATSMLWGTIIRTTLESSVFTVMKPAGANGCDSATGLRVDGENRRLIVCGGVTGRAYVFDADTGAPLGRYTNGLVTEPPKACTCCRIPSF